MKDTFLQLRDDDIDLNLQCSCEQNCMDSEVYINDMIYAEITHGILRSTGAFITLNLYPSVRYMRRILFSFPDLFGKSIKF